MNRIIDLIFSEDSSYDIRGIYEYISYDSINIAKKFITKLVNYTYTISLFPELGTLVLKQYSIRKLVYHNYIIIYQLDYNQKTINIIKILNSKQDINKILKSIKKYIV